MRSDLGHELTEKELAKLEKRVASVYDEAAKDMQKTIDAYFDKLKTRDAKMKAICSDPKLFAESVAGTASAGMTADEYYKQWRLAQIGRGQRYEAMRDKLAERATKANETAISYVNDATPSIYSLNRNYTAYTIEQVADNVDFALFDESTVRRLIKEQPDVMPSYPEERAVARGIDLAYGKQQITASVTSSILQGKSVPDMAKDLQTRITTMNKTSAVRAARTSVTAAQNAGRQDSITAAQNMGINVQKEWMATKDERTRAWHGEADGQRVKPEESFKVGGEKMRFPADPWGSGWNTYNCRCTMKTFFPEYPDDKPRQTYSEWLKEKQKDAIIPNKAAEKEELKNKILNSSTTSQMSEEQKNEFTQILDGMSEENLEFYRTMTDFHENNIYNKTKGGAFYDPAKKNVSMNLSNTKWEKSVGRESAGGWKTKFHEELHQIDHVLGITETGKQWQDITKCKSDWFSEKTSIGERLEKAITSDIIKLFNDAADAQNNLFGNSATKHISDLTRLSSVNKDAVWNYLIDNVKTSKDKAMLSVMTDALSMTTSGRMDVYKKGYWGHEASYAKENGMNGATSECFAELGSHIMRNDTEALKYMEKWMPNSLAEYKSVISELAQYAKSNALHY